jgi:hypothetical protein
MIRRKDEILLMLVSEYPCIEKEIVIKHLLRRFSNYSDLDFIDHFRKYFPNIQLIRKNTFAI